MYGPKISYQQMYKQSIKLSLEGGHLGAYGEEAIMNPSTKYMGKLAPNQNLNSNYKCCN